MRARHNKAWARAADFLARSREAADKLTEPLRSRIQSQIEIQWAEILYRQGHLDGAEDMMRRGLSVGERFFAPQSEMLLQGYGCWGDLCSDQGRLLDAEGHYRKALEGHELGNDAAGIMFDLQRLGECLMRQQRSEEAERVILRAIAAETRSAREFAVKRGMDPDRYQLTPISLPNLHFCREEYDDARRLFRAQVEHWATQEKRPDNIDLGQMQMRLALAEARAGHLEEAGNAYEQAATCFAGEWCEGHPKAVAAREAKAALGVAAASPA
jgi:tetratricopeptide (TPR) repeat protein